MGSGQYLFLVNLYEQEGINQKALGKLLNVDRANTTRAVKKLEQVGYVESVINSEDKRNKKLYLTKKGHSVVPSIRVVLFRMRTTLLAGFTEEESTEVLDFLGRTEVDIASIFKKLTLPMIFRLLGLVAFNLADTYFVGRLGTIQIAALTFTFPAILVVNSINLGIGIGAFSLISKVVGERNREKIIRLLTSSLSLGFLIAVVAIIIGE